MFREYGPAIPATNGSNGHTVQPERVPEDVTVGDTPWAVVAGIAAAFAALGALVAWTLRR
jgi:hypothetical protein